MPTETFERLITSMVKCAPTLRSVVFSGGGEPSIHPYLPTAIHRLTDAGIDVGVISNGVHVTEPLLHAYLRCAWVRFSIDFPWASTYVDLMSPHKPENFSTVLQNMRLISDAKGNNPEVFPTLGLAYIVTKGCQSDEALYRCLDLGAEAGADYVMYRPLVDLEEEQITRSLADFEALIPEIDAYAKRLGIAHQFHKFVREFDKTVNRTVPTKHKECPVVQDGLVGYVAATGDVVPCYAIYMQTMSDKWIYGNVNQMDFLDIWDGPMREEVINRIDARVCPFCRFQGHNKILMTMGQGEKVTYDTSSDRHWKFL